MHAVSQAWNHEQSEVLFHLILIFHGAASGRECTVHPAPLRLNLEKIFSNLLKLIKLFPLSGWASWVKGPCLLSVKISEAAWARVSARCYLGHCPHSGSGARLGSGVSGSGRVLREAAVSGRSQAVRGTRPRSVT